MARSFALSLSADRPPLARVATALLALAVHVALLAYWQQARTVPAALPESAAFAVQWIRLPPLAPRVPRVTKPVTLPQEVRRPARLAGVKPLPTQSAASAPAATEPAATLASELDPPAEAAVPATDGHAIMERARRSVAGVDRALRRENHPTITAPLESPQIRMRERMEEAQALAQPRVWEAPKVEQLVNSTADGARRTRVITGRGSYCITERSPVTSIDMIEKHGKLRITNCPQHESTAKRQRWRTARD